MAKITVGLTNNKTSFWDPNTRTYLTLANKVKTIEFDENSPDIAKHLERICHGLFASSAAIRLYEGQIPAAALDHWKGKFDLKGLMIAKNRADKLHAESGPAPIKIFSVASEEPEKKTEEVKQEEKVSAKTTRKKTTTTEK